MQNIQHNLRISIAQPLQGVSHVTSIRQGSSATQRQQNCKWAQSKSHRSRNGRDQLRGEALYQHNSGLSGNHIGDGSL